VWRLEIGALRYCLHRYGAHGSRLIAQGDDALALPILRDWAMRMTAVVKVRECHHSISTKASNACSTVGRGRTNVPYQQPSGANFLFTNA